MIRGLTDDLQVPNHVVRNRCSATLLPSACLEDLPCHPSLKSVGIIERYIVSEEFVDLCVECLDLVKVGLENNMGRIRFGTNQVHMRWCVR